MNESYESYAQRHVVNAARAFSDAVHLDAGLRLILATRVGLAWDQLLAALYDARDSRARAMEQFQQLRADALTRMQP